MTCPSRVEAWSARAPRRFEDGSREDCATCGLLGKQPCPDAIAVFERDALCEEHFGARMADLLLEAVDGGQGFYHHADALPPYEEART